MDFEAQRRLYFNLCNPRTPLKPDEERNVDIDAMDEANPVRGLNWVKRLARTIEFSVADDAVEKPACVFFTGLPGSGKSTEILRLSKRLSDPHGANLLTVVIDAERVIDLNDTIDLADIYVALVYETERAVLTLEGKDADKALKDGVMERMGSLLDNLSLSVTAKYELAALGATLALEMKEQPSLRQEIRRRVAANTTRFLRECRSELKTLRERAKRCGRAGVVIIFDSLEKLSGTSHSFSEVLDSAERLFSSGDGHLHLPVHALYTVPPALILRLRRPVEFMPMIKLWDRSSRTPFAPGFKAAQTLVERRIPDRALLGQFFGAKSEAELDQRLRRVIEWSAGYPREIVRLLRNVILDGPLDDNSLERLLGQAGDDYRRLLLESDLEWLARVALATDDTPLPRDEIQRQAADRMFANNVVLRYQNSSEWYEIHPSVRNLPILKETMERLRAQRVS